MAGESWFGPVDLGAECVDTVTGFSGTATARTVYLGGNIQVRLERPDPATGKPEEVWLPEARLASPSPRRPGFDAGGPGEIPATSATGG